MATKKKAAATQNLDSMFGFETIKFGETELKMRRVLSRTQQRAVADAIASVGGSQVKLNKILAPAEDGEEPKPQEQIEEEANALEDQMHADLRRGTEAYLANADDMDLEEWGTPSLSQLFSVLHQRAGKLVGETVSAHFPKSGPSA